MLREHNVVVKNPRRVELRFASCYPNLYRSAMSSLGFHIIYDFLNHREDTYCERVVYPHAHSLETGTKLKHFDLVGFSLQYEEDYIHVLEMLRQGGLSLRKEDRSFASFLADAESRLSNINSRISLPQAELDRLTRQFWVTKEQVKANKYDLSASRYRQVDGEAVYHPEPAEILDRLLELEEVMKYDVFALQAALGVYGSESNDASVDEDDDDELPCLIT